MVYSWTQIVVYYTYFSFYAQDTLRAVKLPLLR